MHTLTIETVDECRWDTSFTVLEPNEFLINLGEDTLIHLGSSLQLWQEIAVNEPDRVKELSIKPLDLSAMLCETCEYLPLNSFRYTVTAVDSNGCLAMDDRIVSVDKERYVYVPNVFAPETQKEGDNMFTVFGGEDVEIVQWLRVFDRWGQLIYQREGFSPNDSSAGWDGKVKGEVAAPAVFVWQTEVLFKDGAAEKWSGSVTLVR
jgi:hypothetical protein